MTSVSTEISEPNGPWLRSLHIATLSCLAFAQPLLDLLGRTAEFFVIRRIGALELFSLLGLLLLLLPLPFLAITLSGERFGRRAGRITGAIVVGILAGLIALRVESATRLLDGLPAIAVAALAGLVAGLSYHRHDLLRGFVTYLSPALVIVPLVFLLQSNVRRAVFPPEAANQLNRSGAHSPIFFLVFDELSFASLVNEQGIVDATRYPNLAKLAGSATWYRNAHTVADTTNIAIPAMLTSKYPKTQALPLLADHPVNLFTLFGGDYRIWADEPITRLCPQAINTRGQFSPPASRQLASLGLDLSVVWLHLVLPQSYRQHLPSISNGWEGFATTEGRPAWSRAPLAHPTNEGEFFTLAQNELSQGDRADRFRGFLSDIDPDEDRALYFSHVMLPHVPWEHSPSGRLYLMEKGLIPGLIEDTWQQDPVLVRLARIRYLMQVEFLDRLIGELVGTLERKGLYDKSLIVLVADHGVSFREGDHRRAFSHGNAVDIVPVPLIIKAPRQSAGEVVDAPVSILDILPTVMDILDVAAPTTFEGRSTRGARPATPPAILVSTKSDGEQTVALDAIDTGKYDTARLLASLIGPPSDPYRYSRSAPNADLLGKSVATLPLRNGGPTTTLSDAAYYRDYDPNSARSPHFVTAGVTTDGNDCCDMAVAINGTIVATGRTSPLDGPLHQFGAMLPDDSLRKGPNDVRIYRVVASGGSSRRDLVLERTDSAESRSHALVLDEHGRPKSLRVGERDYRLGTTLSGYIESVDRSGDMLRINGWAADRTRKRLVNEIVVFYRGKYLVSGATLVAKEYVANALGSRAFLYSGYSFDVPASSMPDLAEQGIRLFAISDDGEASELGMPFLRLERGPEGEYLLSGSGKHYPIGDATLTGRIESITPDREGCSIRGWAGDPKNGMTSSRIVVVYKGKVVKEALPLDARPDLGANPDNGLQFGFSLQVDAAPDAARKALASAQGRIFAVSMARSATELKLVAGTERR